MKPLFSRRSSTRRTLFYARVGSFERIMIKGWLCIRLVGWFGWGWLVGWSVGWLVGVLSVPESV